MTDSASTETVAEATTPAPETPATQEPAAPAEKVITKAEHDADMARQRIEMKELKAAAAELAALKKAQMTEAEAAKAEAEEAKADAAAARAELAAAKLDAMKTRIGTAKGLPPALAELLKGDDEAAINLHADTLLAALPKSEAPGVRPGVTTDPAETDPFLRGLLGT